MSQPPSENFSMWTQGGVLEQSNQVDDWIAIEIDGTVTAKSGKVELGTGVRTALAQIAAEELGVAFERVRMVMGDTARTPDEGYTAGSKTIHLSGFALRHASAEARRALLDLASDQLDATVDELVVNDGVVSVAHHPSRTISYAELMGGKKFNRAITGNAPLKRPDDYRIVGKPMPRVDLPLKFTGGPSFIHDLKVPGMMHGRVVRPPSVGAVLVSIDEKSVRDARVVRLGNFIGVVAEREENAVRAAKDLPVTWNETARLPAMDELYDYLRRQPTTEEIVTESGAVARALEQSTQVLTATYYQPYQAHASIGPSCAVADFANEQLTVWCSTQGVFPLRGALADFLKMPPAQVRVIHVEGAGCYGHNGADDVAADAAILSRAIGKPVRVQWSREDEFAWEPYAPAMVMEVRGGLDTRGDIVGWDYQAWSPSHANRARVGMQLIAAQLVAGKGSPPSKFFMGGSRNAPTNYVLPNQRITMRWLAQSPLRASSYRSLGAFANTFANESFIDELAHAARMDPLEFRLRHLDDARAIDVLKSAAQNANWGTPMSSGEGRGIAFACYENDEAYAAAVAQVHVDSTSGEVRVARIVVAHDCGLIINPDGLRNQIEGNVIQAVSRTLKEQVTFDETRVTSRDWETYPILKFSEMPAVEVILINRLDQPAVGAGEPATIIVAPAIANAIFAATGARVREIPFTPKRIRSAMGK